MAFCGKVFQGFENPCNLKVTGFRQIAVLINLEDIDLATVVKTMPNYTLGTCEYSVEFDLKCGGTKGVSIKAIEAGTAIKGYFDKKRNDNGYAQYIHKVDIILSGIDKDVNCVLSSLDVGRYAIALLANDGTVVIYGFSNGLSTDDYTYDIVDGGGSAIITLTSNENNPESTLPLIYKAGLGSTAILDFEAEFENAVACP